jgi:hypothetical protein
MSCFSSYYVLSDTYLPWKQLSALLSPFPSLSPAPKPFLGHFSREDKNSQWGRRYDEVNHVYPNRGPFISEGAV